MPLLHLNLGVAFLRQQSWKDGRRALEQALVLRPAHANAHKYLALAYEQEGFKVPALLALTRFLLLDPAPDRAKDALGAMDRLFGIGFERDSSTGNVTLTVDPDGSNEEGNFRSAELGMLLARAGSELKDPPASEEPARPPLVRRLWDALAMAAETGDVEPHGFASRYYVPYFAALHAAGQLDAAVYVALRASGEPAVKDWLAAHEADVKAFRAFSEGFVWPKPSVGP